MTLTSSGTDAVIASGGSITLTADFLDIGKVVNAGGGNLLIQTVTVGEQISLGSAATGGLTLSEANLQEITAEALTIGNSSKSDRDRWHDE